MGLLSGGLLSNTQLNKGIAPLDPRGGPDYQNLLSSIFSGGPEVLSTKQNNPLNLSGTPGNAPLGPIQRLEEAPSSVGSQAFDLLSNPRSAPFRAVGQAVEAFAPGLTGGTAGKIGGAAGDFLGNPRGVALKGLSQGLGAAAPYVGQGLGFVPKAIGAAGTAAANALGATKAGAAIGTGAQTVGNVIGAGGTAAAEGISKLLQILAAL